MGTARTRSRATFVDKDHWTNKVRGVLVLEDCTLTKDEEAERRRKLEAVLY